MPIARPAVCAIRHPREVASDLRPSGDYSCRRQYHATTKGEISHAETRSKIGWPGGQRHRLEFNPSLCLFLRNALREQEIIVIFVYPISVSSGVLSHRDSPLPPSGGFFFSKILSRFLKKPFRSKKFFCWRGSFANFYYLC